MKMQEKMSCLWANDNYYEKKTLVIGYEVSYVPLTRLTLRFGSTEPSSFSNLNKKSNFIVNNGYYHLLPLNTQLI